VKGLLLLMYLVSAGLEIAGVWYTGKIGLRVIKRGNPPLAVGLEFPEERQVKWALGLVLAGVVIGLLANMASLVN